MKKLKPLKSTIIGCLNCGHTPAILPMRTRLYQGFGGYHITKNGKLEFMGKDHEKWEDNRTLSYIEKNARLDPDADWRCHIDLPLRSAVYQRQGKSKWILVKTGMGFA